MRNPLSLRRALVLASAVVVCLAPAAQASSYVVINDTSFSYTGTVTDPTGATTAIPSYTDGGVTYTGRDASIYVTSNAPTGIVEAGSENVTQVQTAWYPTLAGSGNPNNTSVGFLSYWALDNDSITSATGSWNATRTQFTLNITGSDLAWGPNDTDPVARLWDAPSVVDDNTRGTFETFNLSLVATFADPATEEFSGWYSTDATPISVTGSMTGTFLNQNSSLKGTDASSDGEYSFDLTFQGQNWASTVGADGTNSSYFGAAVPEPATWAMFLVGFGLLGFMMRGSRRNAMTVTA